MWQKLVSHNPMMAEPARFVRQLTSPGQWKGQQIVMGVIVAIIFLFFMAMTIVYSDSMEPGAMIYVMMGLIVLVVPVNLHGVIAGEREKRSLDMLLAAPLSAQQIVFAKILRVLVPLTLIVVGFGIPGYILAIKRSVQGAYTSYADNTPHEFLLVTNGLLLTFFFAVFVAVLTVYISSITRNTVSALISSIGALFFYLAVLPLMLMPFFWLSPWVGEVVGMLHPFGALTMVLGYWGGLSTNWLSGWFVPIVTVPSWIIASFFMFSFASARLEADRRLGDRRRSKE